MEHIISVLVENKFGVLARVAGLFSARGYNIESLSVAPTLDPTTSMITIVTVGDDRIIEQIMKQLNKVVEVLSVVDHTETDFLDRETVLIKVNTKPEHRDEAIRIAEIFRAKIVDSSPTTYTIEITGDVDKVEAMIGMLKPLGIKGFDSHRPDRNLARDHQNGFAASRTSVVEAVVCSLVWRHRTWQKSTQTKTPVMSGYDRCLCVFATDCEPLAVLFLGIFRFVGGVFFRFFGAVDNSFAGFLNFIAGFFHGIARFFHGLTGFFFRLVDSLTDCGARLFSCALGLFFGFLASCR